MTTTSYTSIPALRDVVLEESFVLDIVAQPARLTILLDAVLTPSHSRYCPPPPDEQFCFHRARLVFQRVHRLAWEQSLLPSATDTSGEQDFGGIDQFESYAKQHVLSGEWGRINVTADTVVLELVD